MTVMCYCCHFHCVCFYCCCCCN